MTERRVAGTTEQTLPTVTYKGEDSSTKLPFTFEIDRQRLAEFLREEGGLTPDEIAKVRFTVSHNTWWFEEEAKGQVALLSGRTVFPRDRKGNFNVEIYPGFLKASLGAAVDLLSEFTEMFPTELSQEFRLERGKLIESLFARRMAAEILHEVSHLRDFGELENLRKLSKRFRKFVDVTLFGAGGAFVAGIGLYVAEISPASWILMGLGCPAVIGDFLLKEKLKREDLKRLNNLKQDSEIRAKQMEEDQEKIGRWMGIVKIIPRQVDQ